MKDDWRKDKENARKSIMETSDAEELREKAFHMIEVVERNVVGTSDIEELRETALRLVETVDCSRKMLTKRFIEFMKT